MTKVLSKDEALQIRENKKEQRMKDSCVEMVNKFNYIVSQEQSHTYTVQFDKHNDISGKKCFINEVEKAGYKFKGQIGRVEDFSYGYKKCSECFPEYISFVFE
jgi:hypothetical protein